MPAQSPARARLLDAAATAQPLATAPIFISAITGHPPMWSAWLIALAPWVLYFALSGRLARRTPFDLAIAVFVAGLLVGFWVSPDKTVSFEALQTTLACILFYYGLVNNENKGRGYWLAMAGIVGRAVIVVFAVWFFSQGTDRLFPYNEWLFRPTSVITATKPPFRGLIHVLGMLLAVTIPVLAAIALHRGETKFRLWALAECLVLMALLLFSASGTGMIAVALGMTFVLASWRLWTIGVIAPSLGATALAVGLNLQRFAWAGAVFPAFSFHARWLYWQRTIDFVSRSPLAGIGLGNWAAVQENQYRWLVVNAHNSYLQLYADTGVLGVAAAVIACIVFVKLSWRILSSRQESGWRPVAIGMIGAIVAGGAGSFLDVLTTAAFKTDRYHYIGVPLLWVLAAGLVMSYRRMLADSQSRTRQVGEKL